MSKSKASRLTFGKHNGERLDNVPVDYLRWLAETKPNSLAPGQLDEVRRLLAREPARNPTPGTDPVLERALEEKAARREKGPLVLDPEWFDTTTPEEAPPTSTETHADGPSAAETLPTSPAPDNIYHRIRRAKERLDDREWCDKVGGRDAARELVNAEMGMSGAVTLTHLLDLLEAFADEAEWAKHGYNVMRLSAELSERRKMERAANKYAESTVRDPSAARFVAEGLDAEGREFIADRTRQLRSLMRKTAMNIIDIGRRLIEVKERLPHGQFGPWLHAEFEWSDDTARRYMQVAEKFGAEKPQIAAFAPSALYSLSAPSVSDEAREEALERAAAGETISRATAARIVEQHRGTPPADGLNVRAIERDGVAWEFDEEVDPDQWFATLDELKRLKSEHQEQNRRKREQDARIAEMLEEQRRLAAETRDLLAEAARMTEQATLLGVAPFPDESSLDAGAEQRPIGAIMSACMGLSADDLKILARWIDSRLAELATPADVR